MIAHGKHVADVGPFGELNRLRETIKVLSDPAVVPRRDPCPGRRADRP